MPSECDLVNNTTVTQQLERKNFDNNMETLANRDSNGTDLMSTSQTSNTSSNGHSEHSNSNGGSRKASITSPDPTAYVAKARVTRPTPPPPSYNPMQFVQIKPCNLYQTAQEQLKKAEEVKKIKEIKKEEPEEWQNNLDNWKSSRRKRVEHIIDRVVEVKKLELEEHDRTRRKSKTFSEMIEERGERPPRPGLSKLVSLAVYNEDESNDLSDLGIGTSSASGKSSLSEDYDNNSVLSDNAELDKVIGHSKNGKTNGKMREYISSPGYDTSSSTAPGSSPDPCEYTYEGAIQDYKQRVSRAQANTTSNYNGNGGLKTMDNETTPTYPTRRGSKIEDRLIGFEVTSPSDSQEGAENKKVDVPKIDISKRKEIFEAAQNGLANKEPKQGITAPRVTLREHFKCETTNGEAPQSGLKKEAKRLSGDLGSIRNRLQSLETNVSANANAGTKVMDIPVPPLKERLSSLQNAVTKEEVKKAPVLLVDARQLEIMRKEDEDKIKQLQQLEETKQELQKDGNDSGIHTADNELEEQENAAACSEREQAKNLQELKEQEQQLNAAIAALAMEEKQLEEAAMAVNQIEAEFAELTTNTAAGAANDNDLPTQQACEMEFSINEALELALEAIDKESPIKAFEALAKEEEEQYKLKKNIITMKQQQQQQQQSNKTDEEKVNTTQEEPPKNQHEKIQQNQQLQQQQSKEENEAREEALIAREPIYENISAASNDLEAEQIIIIPNQTQSKLSNNNNYYNNNNHNNNNHHNQTTTTTSNTNFNHNNNIKFSQTNSKNLDDLTNAFANLSNNHNNSKASITTNETIVASNSTKSNNTNITNESLTNKNNNSEPPEPYYQVPKSSEPYYDAPKHLRPVPLYENIDVFYNGLENSSLSSNTIVPLEPPKEKPPPPPTESPPHFDDDNESELNSVDLTTQDEPWSSDNTYETIASRKSRSHMIMDQHPSPPIKRINSTKRIKKELRNKRSSFLGIECNGLDDEEQYLQLTVAPPPDMAQLLQEERRLEKQLYLKAGLCDSSDTGESRDSGVSENHSRQSSEHYTNSSEENERTIESPPQLTAVNCSSLSYQNDSMLCAAQTPLLQTVKGNSADAWTESATVAAAASQSLTEATATANAKMHSIEEKIREQEEVLRVERELLQLEQEELKRQRENLMLRENMARRELQHGAKMLMSAATDRRSLQDLQGLGGVPLSYGRLAAQPTLHQPQATQQIYANVPNLQQQQFYQQVETDYRKSMSDLNEFSKRHPPQLSMLPPSAPSKPMRTLHMPATNGQLMDDYAPRQRHSLNATQAYGGSLVKIATPTAAPRGASAASVTVLSHPAANSHIYSNYNQHQSAHNLNHIATTTTTSSTATHGNMTRNTLHALSATPKPKYTDGWVQIQNRKSYENNHMNNDADWLTYQQKRKSMPPNGSLAGYNNNHWLVQEAEQRRIVEQQQRRSVNSVVVSNGASNGLNPSSTTANGNGKPLPDSIIQTLTERVQSKGIGERKRTNNMDNNKSPIHAAAYHQQLQQNLLITNSCTTTNSSQSQQQISSTTTTTSTPTSPDKVLSVSGKKKCSHCGDELGRGAAMIIESLLLFYHINCFKCCVCHVQLGDGLNGTDVRVRNHKLHCQNCYSSDDGIKFSCV